MPTLISELPDRIRRLACEKCDEPIDEGEDSILTFCRGSFIRLHEECGDYIDTATKGARRDPRKLKWSNAENQARESSAPDTAQIK